MQLENRISSFAAHVRRRKKLLFAKKGEKKSDSYSSPIHHFNIVQWFINIHLVKLVIWKICGNPASLI